jgi:hypothetical protein
MTELKHTFPISLSNLYNLKCNRVEIQNSEANTKFDVEQRFDSIDLSLEEKGGIITSYIIPDEGQPGLDLFHTPTQLSKLISVWEINIVKHDDLGDELYSAVDFRISDAMKDVIYNKYGTGMTYTQTEINNLLDAKNGVLNSVGLSGTDLLWSGTEISKINVDDNFILGRSFPNSEIYLKLNTTTINNLYNYYNKDEIINISNLSNYYSDITINTILNQPINSLTNAPSSIIYKSNGTDISMMVDDNNIYIYVPKCGLF